ncbi:hypothetical protein ACN27G_06105 [Plantactinospora sp. WMMB334]|uniref:hypothetical protein n=1 Tax=Plantactinospora sp. WMMB334 TaxID=3404119 RepID=UPI003B93F622
MEQKYEVGERITALIRDARVEEADDSGRLVLTYGGNWRAVVHTGSGQVGITRMTPADGVPQPGELWRDQAGQLWFARGTADRVLLIGADAKTQHPGMTAMDWQSVHRGDTGPIRRIWRDDVPADLPVGDVDQL